MRITFLLLCLFSYSLVYCQDGIAPTIDRLQGIWGANIEENVEEYYIITGNRCIILSYFSEKASIFGNPYSYIGFWDQNHYPTHISELKKKGNKLFFYDYLGRNYDESGYLNKISKRCYITMNENELPTDTIPKYFSMSCGRQPDYYSKINFIPLKVLKSLRNNSKDWKKYTDFVKSIPKTERKIKAKKAYIYSEPEVQTKMYLIENDTVEILEDKGEWLLMRYYGKKVAGRVQELENHTGFPGTIDYRLVVDARFKKYGELLNDIDENAFLDRDVLANYSQPQIDAYWTRRNALENEFENFFVNNPNPQDFIVDHGLKELEGTVVPGICEQYTFWYRDRIYSINDAVGSPPNKCFYLGRNPFVYNETLQQIDGLGLLLSPFNFDWVADAMGFFYSGIHCDFGSASLYAGGLVIPVMSTGALKGSTKALINGLRKGDSEIVEVGGELVIRKIAKADHALNLSETMRRHLDELKALGKVNALEADELARLLAQNRALSTKIETFGDLAPDMLTDLAKMRDQAHLFARSDGLVDSWAIVKNTGFDDLARNTDVLEEVTKLGAKTLDGNPLDIAKLFDNGLGKTLDKVSDVDKTKILSRINEWDASKVDDLARRLGKDNYPNLADDLADPDFFKLYDDIINDPENALDIAKKAGDGNLTTTAKSTFFNDITKLGKDFEGVVAPALRPGGAWRNKLSDVVKNKFGIDDLDSYEMYEQVQFTYNKSTGDYFVADQTFVKYGFDADGDKFIENIIVIENKLSDATKLTGNQSAARSVSEYTVRSRQFVELSQGLEVKSNNWLRAYGDGSGKNILDITDEFK
jgi:hypothetical protein